MLLAKTRTDKVRQLQRVLYQKAKSGKGVKFYSLYDKICREDVLWEAWQQVKANRGAAGVDEQEIEDIVRGEKEEKILLEIGKSLRSKTYHPSPVRRVDIPKPKGGMRSLGIATVRDRIVQTAMKMVLEAIFEADFHECSYGYRPNRDAKMASLQVREDLYKTAWGVVEIDFKDCFGSISHRNLLLLIGQRVSDGSMMALIKQCLKAGVEYQGQRFPTKVGIPQGSPLSPLFSNIYLNVLDQAWHRRGYHLPDNLHSTLHRYADDAILVCRKSGKQALQAFAALAKRMGLTLNEEKTRITKLTEGFDFIGFKFVKRKSPSTGKNTIYIFPSQSTQKNIRRKIKSFTKRRAPIKVEEFVAMVNEAVRGWANYFRHANASEAFRRLQRFINIRFRRFLTYRGKDRGFGWKKYPNRKLYQLGLIYIGSGYLRWEKARRMPAMKAVRPPYSGKLNVRWDGKGMVNQS